MLFFWACIASLSDVIGQRVSIVEQFSSGETVVFGKRKLSHVQSCFNRQLGLDEFDDASNQVSLSQQSSSFLVQSLISFPNKVRVTFLFLISSLIMQTTLRYLLYQHSGKRSLDVMFFNLVNFPEK